MQKVPVGACCITLDIHKSTTCLKGPPWFFSSLSGHFSEVLLFNEPGV